VLRDGRVAALAQRGEFGAADLVQAMTVRAAERQTIVPADPGDLMLEDADSRADPVRVRAREVLGLAGLLGSGTERVLHRLFGLAREPAEVRVNNERRRLDSPRTAVNAGVGMVPRSRRLGVVMNLSVRDNILLPSLDRLRRAGWLMPRAGQNLVDELMELLDIRPRQPELKVSALSGGNQQKVILAKWLARRVQALLLDEPTQGIDVAAKAQIHALIRNFAARGGGVLLSSSDLSELAQLCDAVLALRHGRIVARLDSPESRDEERIHAAIVA
jgi:ribose transport system ATP-binding protein